jgi:hypothetical protein
MGGCTPTRKRVPSAPHLSARLRPAVTRWTSGDRIPTLVNQSVPDRSVRTDGSHAGRCRGGLLSALA